MDDETFLPLVLDEVLVLLVVHLLLEVVDLVPESPVELDPLIPVLPDELVFVSLHLLLEPLD